MSASPSLSTPAPRAPEDWLPWLDIEVAHGYFADGRCRGLRFLPSAGTARWLDARGALLREGEGRLALYGPPGGLPREPGQVLHWRLHAADEAFGIYTDQPARWPDEVLYFDAAEAVAAPDRPGWRMHAGLTAGRADTRPLTWPLVSQGLQGAPRQLPPLGLVRVPLHSLPPSPAQFHLRLAARATVWKYCLHGDWSEPGLEVVDPSQAALFEPPRPDRMDSGAAMLAIRSRAPIALAQRSACRFQLRSRQRGGHKVLVQRLPVASARFLGREQIGSTTQLVSEIHVHR